MVNDLEPDEQAVAQFHIGTSMCECLQECTELENHEISYIMEYLYEKEPMPAKQISDEMFDENCRRVNKITPMMIGKKYIPILKRTGMIEVSEGLGGARYRLNGYRHAVLGR